MVDDQSHGSEVNCATFLILLASGTQSLVQRFVRHRWCMVQQPLLYRSWCTFSEFSGTLWFRSSGAKIQLWVWSTFESVYKGMDIDFKNKSVGSFGCDLMTMSFTKKSEIKYSNYLSGKNLVFTTTQDYNISNRSPFFFFQKSVKPIDHARFNLLTLKFTFFLGGQYSSTRICGSVVPTSEASVLWIKSRSPVPRQRTLWMMTLYRSVGRCIIVAIRYDATGASVCVAPSILHPPPAVLCTPTSKALCR